MCTIFTQLNVPTLYPRGAHIIEILSPGGCFGMHARSPRLTLERAHTHARVTYIIFYCISIPKSPFRYQLRDVFARWVQFVVISSPPPPRGIPPANYWMQILYPPVDSPETRDGLLSANVHYLYTCILCVHHRVLYYYIRCDGAVSEISENPVTLFSIIYMRLSNRIAARGNHLYVCDFPTLYYYVSGFVLNASHFCIFSIFCINELYSQRIADRFLPVYKCIGIILEYNSERSILTYYKYVFSVKTYIRRIRHKTKLDRFIDHGILDIFLFIILFILFFDFSNENRTTFCLQLYIPITFDKI